MYRTKHFESVLRADTHDLIASTFQRILNIRLKSFSSSREQRKSTRNRQGKRAKYHTERKDEYIYVYTEEKN